MAAAYVLKKSADEQYYFNLRAENNETLLTSERYARKDSALSGIESMRRNAEDDQRFARKVSARGQHYFVLTAANGEPLGQSEEYASAAAMENGIAAVKRVAPSAPIVEQV
jgi:uncharacterized protein YegP (UPF0339 family)